MVLLSPRFQDKETEAWSGDITCPQGPTASRRKGWDLKRECPESDHQLSRRPGTT